MCIIRFIRTDKPKVHHSNYPASTATSTRCLAESTFSIYTPLSTQSFQEFIRPKAAFKPSHLLDINGFEYLIYILGYSQHPMQINSTAKFNLIPESISFLRSSCSTQWNLETYSLACTTLWVSLKTNHTFPITHTPLSSAACPRGTDESSFLTGQHSKIIVQWYPSLPAM